MINKKFINQAIKINKGAYVFQNKGSLDFSISENPLETFPSGIKKIIINNIKNINKYPLEEINELKTVIAKKFGLKTNNIALGNGLEQIIDIVFRTITNPNDEVLIPLPSFFLFEKSAFLAKSKVVFIKPNLDLKINLEKIKQKVNKKTKIIIFSNPNNPTGQVIKKKLLIRFIKTLPNVIIVIDEANIEFGGQSLIREIKKFNNLIILRTFSKAFGLAGFRVGFAAGQANIIKMFNIINQPMPINLLACLACKEALKNNDFLLKVKKFTANQRNLLISSFTNLGFKVFPSQANNILIKTDFKKFTDFLTKNNISVVDASCFRGLTKGFFRISPRTKVKNIRLVKLLQKYYK